MDWSMRVRRYAVSAWRGDAVQLTMARALVVLSWAVVCTMPANPAAAQSSYTSPVLNTAQADQFKPAPPASPRARVFFTYDLTFMKASRTFETIFGTDRLEAFGAGVDVRVWKGLFLRVAASRAQREDGERVVLFQDEVIPLGIPVTVQIVPIDLGVGWRVPIAADRLTPYVGASYVRLRYQETSPFANTGDDVNETFNGVAAYGGVEVAVTRWLIAGIEAQYRLVPDAIGAGGVSAQFGERDLGGFVARGLIGIRR